MLFLWYRVGDDIGDRFFGPLHGAESRRVVELLRALERNGVDSRRGEGDNALRSLRDEELLRE